LPRTGHGVSLSLHFLNRAVWRCAVIALPAFLLPFQLPRDVLY
jgi:hypothetical protein